MSGSEKHTGHDFQPPSADEDCDSCSSAKIASAIAAACSTCRRQAAAAAAGSSLSTASMISPISAMVRGSLLRSRMARYAAALDMKVFGWSPNLAAERAAAAGAGFVPRDELLTQADIVSLHIVLSPITRG